MRTPLANEHVFEGVFVDQGTRPLGRCVRGEERAKRSIVSFSAFCIVSMSIFVSLHCGSNELALSRPPASAGADAFRAALLSRLPPVCGGRPFLRSLDPNLREIISLEPSLVREDAARVQCSSAVEILHSEVASVPGWCTTPCLQASPLGTCVLNTALLWLKRVEGAAKGCVRLLDAPARWASFHRERLHGAQETRTRSTRWWRGRRLGRRGVLR